MYGQMVLWKKEKNEVCLNPDFYLMRSHMYNYVLYTYASRVLYVQCTIITCIKYMYVRI